MLVGAQLMIVVVFQESILLSLPTHSQQLVFIVWIPHSRGCLAFSHTRNPERLSVHCLKSTLGSLCYRYFPS